MEQAQVHVVPEERYRKVVEQRSRLLALTPRKAAEVQFDIRVVLGLVGPRLRIGRHPTILRSAQIQVRNQGAGELTLRHEPAGVPHRTAQRVAARQEEPKDQLFDEVRSRW